MKTSNFVSLQPAPVDRHRPLRITLAAAFGAVMLLCAAAPKANAATLITYFNFEDNNLASDPAVPAPLQASTISGTANTTFGTGTTLNIAPGNTQINNSSLHVAGSTQNGNYIQFSVSTLAISSLSLSYATKSSSNGFSEQLSYSTNGTTFTNVGSVFTPGTAYATTTFDLSGITAINNQATVTFRITFSGASGSGTTDIDNIQLNATAVPEPATVAGGALTLAALCVHQRRRLFGVFQRQSRQKVT